MEEDFEPTRDDDGENEAAQKDDDGENEAAQKDDDEGEWTPVQSDREKRKEAKRQKIEEQKQTGRKVKSTGKTVEKQGRERSADSKGPSSCSGSVSKQKSRSLSKSKQRGASVDTSASECSRGSTTKLAKFAEGIHFVETSALVRALKKFLELNMAKEEIGLKERHHVPQDKDELLHLFRTIYSGIITYTRDDNRFSIKSGCESRFLKRATAHSDCLQEWGHAQGPYENLFSCYTSNDPREKDSQGGTYTTATTDSLVKLFEFIFTGDPLLKTIICDYPRLQDRPLGFMDYGAGCMRPAFVGATCFGMRAHGIENTTQRSQLAAQFYNSFLKDYPNIDLVLHHSEVGLNHNLTGYTIFLVWDRAFPDPIVKEAVYEIAKSTTHDVLVIVSNHRYYERRNYWLKYFDVIEGGTLTIDFMKCSASDTLRMLRLMRRIKRSSGCIHPLEQLLQLNVV